MVSLIKVDNISPAVGGTSSDVNAGLSKAWCNFNMTTTHFIRESLNVSSITDVSSANALLTNTSSFSSVDFLIPTASTGLATANPSDRSIAAIGVSSSSSQYEVYTVAGALYENPFNYASIMGNLA